MVEERREDLSEGGGRGCAIESKSTSSSSSSSEPSSPERGQTLPGCPPENRQADLGFDAGSPPPPIAPFPLTTKSNISLQTCWHFN